MKYGGGRRDLNKEISKLPTSISLLFDNKYLEFMEILCIMHGFKRRTAGVPIEELVYYFTLVNAIEPTGEGYKIDNRFIQNIYLDTLDNIKSRLIVLGQEGLVTLLADKKAERVNPKVCCTENGYKVAKELTSEFYKEVFAKCKYLQENLSFSPKNKLIVWRNPWDRY